MNKSTYLSATVVVYRQQCAEQEKSGKTRDHPTGFLEKSSIKRMPYLHPDNTSPNLTKTRVIEHPIPILTEQSIPIQILQSKF